MFEPIIHTVDIESHEVNQEAALALIAIEVENLKRGSQAWQTCNAFT